MFIEAFSPGLGWPCQEPDVPAIVSTSMYIGWFMSAGVASWATCLPSKYQVMVLGSQSTP